MQTPDFVNINLMRILYKEKKAILRTFIVVFVLFVIITLLMPVWYRSYTTILPPAEDSSLGNFASLMSDLPLKALGLGSGVSDQSILFLAMLKSRTIMESVANEFDLMRRYNAKNMEETIKKLRDHAGAYIEDEGTITLFAEARTPWFSIFSTKKKEEARLLARDMANFFIVKLDSLNKTLKSERGRNNRIFIENRYHQNLSDLRQAEQKLKEFQEEYGTIDVIEQTKATITAAAELKAQIVVKEIQKGLLEQTVSPTHPELLKVKQELIEYNKKYDDFINTNSSLAELNEQEDIFIPMKQIPDRALQYARLYRDVVIQEKIMEFLLPQYEQAKIEEAKNTPTVQILDKAVKPIRKHRPKRAIIVLFFSIMGVAIHISYLIVRPSLMTFVQEIKK